MDSHPSSTSSVYDTKREVPKSRRRRHGLGERSCRYEGGNANLLSNDGVVVCRLDLETTVVGPEVDRDADASDAAFVDLEHKLAPCHVVRECLD